MLLAGLLISCGSSGTVDAGSSSVVTSSSLARSTDEAASADSPATSTAGDEAGATTPPVAVSQMPTDSTTQDTGDTVTGAPKFSGDTDSPFCDVVRQFDQSSPLDTAFGTSTTPESTKENWDSVMKAFGSLRATAPDEIALDVAATTKFIDAMDRTVLLKRECFFVVSESKIRIG